MKMIALKLATLLILVVIAEAQCPTGTTTLTESSPAHTFSFTISASTTSTCFVYYRSAFDDGTTANVIFSLSCSKLTTPQGRYYTRAYAYYTTLAGSTASGGYILNTDTPEINFGKSNYARIYAYRYPRNFTASYNCTIKANYPCSNSDTKCNCGIVPKKNRIINGQPAELYQNPWYAGVGPSQSSGFSLICGATIILEDWVLTAAHCVDNPRQYSVRAGVDNTNTLGNQQIRLVKNTYIHPSWNSARLTDGNDIALLKLAVPFTFNDYVQPACLPYYLNSTAPWNGEETTIIGYGRVDDGTTPNHLRTSETLTYEASNCPYTGFRSFSDKLSCVFDTESGGCFGDSGGPNLHSNGGQEHVVGVTSFVFRSPDCRVDRPTGYTRVADFIDWIECTTGENFCDTSS